MTVIKNATPPWEWSELTVANFVIKHTECTNLIATESDEAADTSGARGTRDENLDKLRAMARLTLTLSKVKYRANPAKLRLFANLTIKSDKIAGTLDEALAV